MRIPTTNKYIFLLMAAVVLASAGDIVSDLQHGAPLAHVLQEAVLMSLASALMLWMLWDVHHQRQQLEDLKQELTRSSNAAKPANPLVQTARKRLSEAVGIQFREWDLSTSEREIGLLLLKGLSIKEIAALRDTHEKTVRQQASAIYRKAGVPGRHAFAAWFMEDLL